MKVSNKTKGVGVKHVIRDIIIFFISVTGISWLYRWSVCKRCALVEVIAFHDVANRAWFEHVIGRLVQEFNVITPAQFAEADFDRSKMNILITFDDGYHSWVENALPVLEAHGLKALFFVNSGIPDAARDGSGADAFFKEKVLLSPKQPITWDDIRILHKRGHLIGGHTQNHANLAQLHGDELYAEIKTDKERHESELGTALTDFAYPFGTYAHYTKEAVEAVKRVGYERAYSALPGFVGSDMYEIPRVLIENNQSFFSIRQWLLGGYALFAKLKF